MDAHCQCSVLGTTTAPIPRGTYLRFYRQRPRLQPTKEHSHEAPAAANLRSESQSCDKLAHVPCAPANRVSLTLSSFQPRSASKESRGIDEHFRKGSEFRISRRHSRGGRRARQRAPLTSRPSSLCRFFPAEGREDEAQARLAKLVKFVPANNPGVTFRLHRSIKKPVVFLLYETFPSQAALDTQPKTVLPAFLKEFGTTPEGLWARAQ